MQHGIIPDTIWVFYPMATLSEILEYRKWCVDNLGYAPYIDQNIIVFKSSEDTVFFKLSHADLS